MNFKVLKEKKVWLPALLVLVLILGGLSSYLYQNRTFFGKDSELAATNDGKYPVYYLLQNDEAKVVAYNTKTQKHILLYSVPMNKNVWNFSAKLSPGGKSIAYVDPSGINVYNLESKETKQIAQNVLPASNGEEVPSNEYVTDPIWSYDGKKIIYRNSVMGGTSHTLADADGSNKNKIENSNNILWSENNYDYLVGNNNEMAGEYGLYSSSDPLYKTEALLTAPNIYSVDKMAFGKDQMIYFSGTKTSDLTGIPPKSVMSYNLSSKKLESVIETTDTITSLAYDEETDLLYFAKNSGTYNENGSVNGMGTFTFNPADKTTTPFYQEETKELAIQSIGKDDVIMTSKVGTWASEALVKLISVSKQDKTITVIGEANKIGFAGWINAKNINNIAEEISAPKPTDKELAAFEISQKTKETLYQTFYNYCWDYDCGSAKYPYSKLAKSKRPELITLESKPRLLTGDVKIPVVFTQFENAPLQNFQIAALKNEQTAGSFGNLAKWINDQAATYKQKLNFSFEYYDPITLSNGEDCYTYQGITKYYDNKCLTAKIDEKYPSLKQEKMILVAFGKSAESYASGGGGMLFDAMLGDKTVVRIASTVDTMESKWDQASQKTLNSQITEAVFNQRLSANYGNNIEGYSVAKLLSIFGAKDKNATQKEPSSANVDACLVGSSSDVMCRQKLVDGKANYLYKLSELTIGEVTKKELGWSDSDGDKVNDVDDRCPFDATDKCS